MEMPDEIVRVVADALERGRAMRSLQKRYFASRDQKTLTEAKAAEAAFDAVLDDAEYALKNGRMKMKQPDLFGGAS